MKNKPQISIKKITPSGALVASALVNGYLMKKTYFGYTKKEVISQFNRYIEKENIN